MKRDKDIDFALWLLISRTYLLVHKARMKEFDEIGIWGRSAGIVSMATRLGENATQSAIVKETFNERNSVSEMLSRMEKDGLLVKHRDLNRKNAVRIELTKKGKEVYRETLKRQSIKDAFTALTEEEKLAFWHILVKIRGKLLELLKMDNVVLYPPSDPENILIRRTKKMSRAKTTV
jgi:MarR family transcriptional regulator for hemolysin